MIGGIIGAAGSVAGGLMGASAAKKQTEAAAEMFRQQLERLDKLQIPDIEKQKLALQSLSYLGTFTPEQEQEIMQRASELNTIAVDPRLKEAQMNALQTLSQLGQTAFTDTEKAELNQMRREVAGQEQARQNAILQSLATRGMLGGGQELAQRLSSSQASADRASQQTDALAAMAQQRMLQSIAQAGALGSSMSQQEFDQQARVKAAQDAINAFNTQNSRDVQMRNVGSRNVAKANEVAERQRIAEANVGIQNQQQQYNKELLQQKFNNEFMKATGASNILGNQANQMMKNAANTGQSYMNIGSGVGKLVGGIAGLFGSGGDTASKTIASMDDDGVMG